MKLPACIRTLIAPLICAGLFSPCHAATPETAPAYEPLIKTESRGIARHFAWGADVSMSIDMSGYDMSTLDAEVMAGYKCSWLRIAGVGVGLSRSFGSGHTFVPVFAVFRSSFRSKPSPLFLDFKAGYSFNTIHDAPTLGDVAASIGMGINLASGRNFKSHIIIGYGFRHFSYRHREITGLNAKNISMAQLAFGINF